MRKKTRKRDEEGKIDWVYEPKLYTQLYYVILVGGLIIFSVGIYMTLINGTSTGITQSRYGGGGTMSLNGPVTLMLSGLFLIPWGIWSIKMALRKRKKDQKHTRKG